MSTGLFTAASGIEANQTQLNVIANNLANVNTIAFKSSSADFQTLLADSISDGSTPSSGLGGTNPEQIGTGAQLADISVNFNQGGSEDTGVNTDLSISGNGFFTLAVPGSTNYLLTRAGNFQLDADGNLVSASGNQVQGTATVNGYDPSTVGTVNVPQNLTIWQEVSSTTGSVVQTWVGAQNSPSQGTVSSEMLSPSDTLQMSSVEMTDFAIGTDGALSAKYSNGDQITVQPASGGTTLELQLLTSSGATFSQDGTGTNVAGLVNVEDNAITPQQMQIQLATVTNPEGLVYEGNNNYSLGVNAGSASFGIAAEGSRGAISAGTLETSNVDISQEFTNMIIAQSGLEAASKVVSVQSQVLQTIIGIIQQ